METYIVYCDETGDDGTTTDASESFILTSLYMPSKSWQSNFDAMRTFRKQLKENYGFHVTQEMHTKNFLTDKNPYRNYNWSNEIKRNILIGFIKTISNMDLSIVNVIIDKTKFTNQNYKVLENALKYNIQRIENDSKNQWNYIMITDKGRIAPMRKTARLIRAYNPIHSKFSSEYTNQPVCGLIEDIMEKDSRDSYFIQICDFVSYFVHLYHKTVIKGTPFPNRVGRLIDETFVRSVMATLKSTNRFNLRANPNNSYGLVIYPK